MPSRHLGFHLKGEINVINTTHLTTFKESFACCQTLLLLTTCKSAQARKSRKSCRSAKLCVCTQNIAELHYKLFQSVPSWIVFWLQLDQLTTFITRPVIQKQSHNISNFFYMLKTQKMFFQHSHLETKPHARNLRQKTIYLSWPTPLS